MSDDVKYNIVIVTIYWFKSRDKFNFWFLDGFFSIIQIEKNIQALEVKHPVLLSLKCSS